MLSPEDNMRMCQTGPGTPMGEAMRRFWIPILSSSQLPEADGDPIKVEIMSQKMVAFRNTEGVVGLIDQQCRHRNASLALGRVEKCGIRCLFHGWLFAPDGTVLEAPTTGFVDKGGNWRDLVPDHKSVRSASPVHSKVA